MDQTDAFGEAMRAHHAGEDVMEIIERDDGWIGVNGVDGYFRDPEEWPDIVSQALERVEGRILDVGCGPGSHALELQERGHDVTGIDVSPGAIEVARDRGVEDVRQVNVANVAEAFDPDTFDAIIMMGNNFGLVGTADTAPERLYNLATVAADDAILVGQSRDPTATDDEHHLNYHERNRDQGRLPGALRIRLRYEVYATLWHDYLLAAPDTMAELAEGTGWEFVEAIEPDEELTAPGGDYVGIMQAET